MFKSANFNNVHEKTIPTLKRGEIAIFQCTHASVDENGTPSYPTYLVPNTDVTFDPVMEEYVDIAYIVSPVVSGKSEQLGEIVFDSTDKGTIVLRGDSPADVIKYQYLKLCNYNENNPNRDTTKMVIFREIDEQGRVKNNLQTAKRDLEMLKFATEAPLDELVAYLRAKGMNPLGFPEDKIRSIVIDEMKKGDGSRPVQKVVTNEMDAKVNELIDSGVIYYDSKTQYYKFTDGDTNIAKVFKVVRDKPAALIAEINKNDELKAKILSLIN